MQTSFDRLLSNYWKTKMKRKISKYRENDALYTREQWKIIAKFSSETTVLRRQKIIYSKRRKLCHSEIYIQEKYYSRMKEK